MARDLIRAIMVLEIAGRPAEHVKQALELHVSALAQVKDVEVISKTISEPKKLESEQEMYTCFAEVEIQTISLGRLMELVFDFMPSSIEIVEPYDLSFNCQEATMFVNDLAGRLHKYDEIAKIAQIQVQQLAGRLQAIQQQSEEKKPQQPILKEDEKKKTKKSRKKYSKKIKNIKKVKKSKKLR